MTPIVCTLPNHKVRVHEHYLYAFEFSDGTIKIGVTWNPRARAQSLGTAFRSRLVRAHIAPVVGRAHRHLAERAALIVARRISQTVRGCTERFAGLKFGEAKNAVAQMARREFIDACAA